MVQILSIQDLSLQNTFGMFLLCSALINFITVFGVTFTYISILIPFPKNYIKLLFKIF